MEDALALYKGVNKDMQGKVQESEIMCFFRKSSVAFYNNVIWSLPTFYQEYWHFNKCQDKCVFNILYHVLCVFWCLKPSFSHKILIFHLTVLSFLNLFGNITFQKMRVFQYLCSRKLEQTNRKEVQYHWNVYGGKGHRKPLLWKQMWMGVNPQSVKVQNIWHWQRLVVNAM